MKLFTLPGLIDPHVHLRDPGQTHKEDFYTGTAAALAGGYTTILDMPNNSEPITTLKRLRAKRERARRQIVCDVGLNFGTLGDNLDAFASIQGQVAALKVYLNVTTGNFVIDANKLLAIYKAWPGRKPIMLHAEDDVSELVLGVLRAVPKPTHMCHVSSQAELEFVIRARKEGLPITCGVTPHHLFLTDQDAKRLGPFGYMKPFLKSQADQDFLWANMDSIDVIESDHAPHTRQEKQSDTPPFGVPGLETTLPLMLTAEREGKLSRQQLIDRLHANPARIFSVTTDLRTKVHVEPVEFELQNESLLTKCGWSPFAGRTLFGKVRQVDIRGEIVFKDGRTVATAGSGQIISG